MEAEPQWPTVVPKPLRTLAWTLFAMGTVSRLAPLADHGGRLLQQYPTEDGYLMLTVSRNMALGHGMSTADGTIPTNGVQPLATFLYALGYLITGADRSLGVAAALLLQFGLACLTAWALLRLGRKVFAARPFGHAIALLAASAWFASPVVVPHSMNCLETGLYGLATVWAAHLFTESDAEARQPWGFGPVLVAGLLLGFAFWARNDAAFLILAACLTYLFCGPDRARETLRARMQRVLCFGSISVVLALPWILNNYLRFGHIMPISGISESLDVTFAKNLDKLPAVLAEYIGVILPIPYALQNTPAFVAACSVFSALYVALLVRVFRSASSIERRLFTLAAIYLLCLSAFYGLFFGAGYFMSRYLFPASPFLALLWAALVAHAFAWARPRVPAALVPTTALCAIAVMVGLHARAYAHGVPHQHFQVVSWVSANVRKDEWVGAIQTGTLGYFHDRTINLDGKVNPEALQARIEDRMPRYAVERGLQFLADWSGEDSMVRWVERDALIAEHFVVEVDSRDPNLVVLRRKN